MKEVDDLRFEDKKELRLAKSILERHEATEDLAHLVDGRIRDVERGVR